MKIEGIMVSKNAKSWDKFRFISGAKSKDQTRFFMTGIHIERAKGKTLMVSTDGRRLHIATLDTLEIEPGDYMVKENTRDFMILYPADEFQYPNWKRIVESLETQKHFKIDINARDKAQLSQTLFSLFKATNAVINIEYLEPLAAVNSAYYDQTWDVYFNDSVQAHTFVNKDLMAIIMPMQKHKEIAVENTVQIPNFVDLKAIEYKPEKVGKTKIAKSA